MDKTASKPMPPCPFCGRPADFHKGANIMEGDHARCSDTTGECDASRNWVSVESWSRRSPSEPQASVREVAAQPPAQVDVELTDEEDAEIDRRIMESRLNTHYMTYKVIAERMRGQGNDPEDCTLSDVLCAARKEARAYLREELERKHTLAAGQREMMGLVEKWRNKRKAGTTDLIGHGMRQAECNCADELEALLKSSGGVREGWQWVPKEPTDEQLLRMFRAFHSDKPEVLEQVMGMRDLSDHQAQLLQDGYCEALAAAPSPEGEK